MRWLTRKLKALVPPGAAVRPGSRAARRLSRARLELEALEDRSVPAATASGTLTGTAFIDANANGAFDAGERALPGVVVNLNGTTNQGTPVNVTATTDANGLYTFINVNPGTYQLSAAPSPDLMGGSPRFGAGTGPQNEDVVPNISFSGAQTVTQNLGFLGLAPTAISMREFLTETTDADFAFPAPGSGQGSAGARGNSAPVVASPIGDISVGTNAPPAVLDLAGTFTDPDITDTKVVLNTAAGAINLELFDKQAPRTVANFLNYINSGAYNNSIFHRLASNFVLQGGGFTFDAAKNTIVTIPADPAVLNEPDVKNRSNLAGTIAMAKLGSDPNSATDQFFFNLADNSSNLDNQNGGFTVFGKIVGPADQSVLNTLTSATIKDESSFNSAFNTIPLNNYTGTKFPTDTTAANFDLIQSASVVSQSEKLTYSVVNNSNPGLVSTAVVNNRLTLTYAAGKSGAATLTVRATDEFGATVDDTFHVSVANQAPRTGVTLSSSSPLPTATLTATATPFDANGDPVTLSYVWKVNANVVKSTSDTKSTTDTLDLKTLSNLHKGDTITLSAIPSDGVLTGATATATATVADTPPTATVSLSSAAPQTNDKLTATATGADADSDPVKFTFTWAVNGKVVQTTSGASANNPTDTLDLSQAGFGDKGQVVTVTVTPNDGAVNGTPATASATVANSPPSVGVVLSSTLPGTNATLTATATPVDPDSDPVTLTYVWAVNGTAVKTTANTTSKTDSLDLSQPSNGNAGDTITVTVTPNDGTASGTAATATATVDRAPVVMTPVANVAAAQNAAPTVLDLAGNFADPDTTNSQVVLNTNGGPVNIQLFDAQAPQTVANFLDYVSSGAYNNSIFHRLATGFVLQGGGFTFNSTGPTINTIPTIGPVPNEPDPTNRSNLAGTVAMAKLPTGPDPVNSATDQFFFNLADNSSNLNTQNGGFTVFGKIVGPADQTALNTLTSATVKNESSFNSALDSIPLNNYNGTNFPTDTTAANYDLIQSAQIVKQTEKLTYSVVTNTNPTLVTAAVQNERLTLTYAANQTGTATITVQATDKAGTSTSTSFNVTVS